MYMEAGKSKQIDIYSARTEYMADSTKALELKE